MLGDIPGELLGVELAGRDHEVVDRLLGLEPEHDRRVSELEVEVEAAASACPPFLVERRPAGFVATVVLPVPPFGEKTVITRPVRPAAVCVWRWKCAALRIAKTTLWVSCGSRSRSLTSASSACSSIEPASPPEAIRTTWCPRLLADQPATSVDPETLDSPCCVQHAVEVAAGEHRRCQSDILRLAD